MKAERNFDIHIFRLSNGKHEYQFEIRDSFFELFDNELVDQGNLVCDVTLDKTDSMIQMSFHIHGSVKLECDRSLDLFDHPIDTHRKMMFKYGEEEKELSEEVMVILKDTQTINIAALLSEFILLEIPMKKLHPRFQSDDEFDEDDDEELLAIYVSEDEDETEEKSEEEQIDPRWEKLKNLKK